MIYTTQAELIGLCERFSGVLESIVSKEPPDMYEEAHNLIAEWAVCKKRLPDEPHGEVLKDSSGVIRAILFDKSIGEKLTYLKSFPTCYVNQGPDLKGYQPRKIRPEERIVPPPEEE